MALVMGALAAGESVTRAAVAAEVGLTRATVSTLVDELLAAGLVEEQGAQRPGTVGRPGTVLALTESGPAGIGAEIGVDHLAACAVDLRGRVRVRAERPAANRGRGADAVLAELAALTGDVIAQAAAAGLTPVRTTVAVPGLIGPDHGTVLRAPNLGWEDVPLAAAFGGQDLDTAVENEANLGALAELWLGGHDGRLTDFVHVSAEIGIGAALVVEGRLFRGARGFAGELGHVPVRPEGPRCSCGATGCLETYAGEEALLRAAGVTTGRGAALKAAAVAGDPSALRALEEAGAALGIALSGAVNLLDPQAVVVGGPLADLAPWLLPGVRRELAVRVTDRRWRAQDVLISRLGHDGVLRGAAYSSVRTVLDDPAAWIRNLTDQAADPASGTGS
ncbi:ROK family transcriptional regulator [Actinacidiphila epipremni]|jgi:predicted NBD/HSP70 family sugar kinase|uniref:ROK family protein n=1 Tax=Actinacidiphila epipremni TaxID=2053013 RepID=A0ABX0ZK93_9ACTN|nr:ROK family transcriptional regulator [Actinacidiphila epipremni]NJP42624.1 ROK family protein [Actinacidiphila epipremni]